MDYDISDWKDVLSTIIAILIQIGIAAIGVYVIVLICRMFGVDT